MTIETSGDVHSAPAVNPVNFTLSDSLDRTVDSFKGASTYPRGFIVNVDGVLSILNISDVVVSIPVIAGLIYPIMVKRYRLTGTSGVTLITALG